MLRKLISGCGVRFDVWKCGVMPGERLVSIGLSDGCLIVNGVGLGRM